MGCLLCKAANQDYRLIFKDSNAFCILNKDPLKKFHLMVLPIRHVESLENLSKDELKSMFDFLHKLESAIKTASGESPIIWMHRGDHPSQPHLHIHIAPSKGDFRMLLSSFENVPYKTEKSKEELLEIRDEIIKFLG